MIGWLGAVCMGAVLGLLGAGGSILTVPIFVYAFGVDPVHAGAYSLFVVGTTAAVGAFRAHRAAPGNIDFKVGVTFAIPALAAVYSVRYFLMPALPPVLLQIGDFELSKSTFILLTFATLMITAAMKMIRHKPLHHEKQSKRSYFARTTTQVFQGLLVGTLSGLVGAGGGFLIIPALVILLGLGMKTAVGTSLLIIAINSLIGFTGDLQKLPGIQWDLLLPFTGLALVGIIIGGHFAKNISAEKLKPAFGWFVLVVGTMMVFKELVTLV